MNPKPFDFGKFQASEKLGDEVVFTTAFTAFAAAIYFPLAVNLACFVDLLFDYGQLTGSFVDYVFFCGASLVGGIFCGVLALLFGTVIVPLSFGLLYFTRKLLHPSSKAAIAGGNVAALFTYWLFSDVALGWQDRKITFVGPVLAIFMGQLGGRIGQWQAWHYNREVEEIAELRSYQFTLRQLLTLTTAICLATAGLRILATWNWPFAFCLLCAVLTQIVLLPVTNFLASRLFLRWQRRATLPPPGGEPHPP